MNRMILLVSYPKSGNTWFRMFISNLLNSSDETININNIKTNGIYSSRSIIDEMLCVETSIMTHDEIDYYRSKVYNQLAKNLDSDVYIKVHDAYTYLSDGMPIIPDVNTKAVYIIRNPLDVSVSLSNHMSKNIDETIDFMNNHESCFCRNTQKITNQLRQKLLSWSEHVESWANAKEINVHVMRYEDMKLNPFETFKNAVHFIGLEKSDDQIQDAIEMSDFNKLKNQEKEMDFNEKPLGLKSFFRKGEIGDWENYLDKEQVTSLINRHRDTMIKYGYLDTSDNIIF